jgi:hypothetical protein
LDLLEKKAGEGDPSIRKAEKCRLILQAIWGRLAEMRQSSMGSIAWSVDPAK